MKPKANSMHWNGCRSHVRIGIYRWICVIIFGISRTNPGDKLNQIRSRHDASLRTSFQWPRPCAQLAHGALAAGSKHEDPSCPLVQLLTSNVARPKPTFSPSPDRLSIYHREVTVSHLFQASSNSWAVRRAIKQITTRSVIALYALFIA